MPSNEKKGRFWMLLPVMLLGASVLGWTVMVRFAVRDESFSIEPNYYQKAVRFDLERAEREASDALGYRLVVENFEAREKKSRLEVSVLDRNGNRVLGLFGSGLGFPIARGNDRRELSFRENSEGKYVAELDGGRLGLWELRVVFTKERATFRQDVRVDLVRSPSGA